MGPFEGCAVGHGSSGGAVAVNTVGTGAKYDDIFSRDLGGAIEDEMLVATSTPRVACNLDCDLAAGNDAHLGNVLAQTAQPIQQIVGCSVILPIIAGVVDLDSEAVAGSGDRCSFFRSGIR